MGFTLFVNFNYFKLIFQLEETRKLSGLAALNRHPSVRRVTPQRMVQRTLKYVNLTDSKSDCYGAGCSYNTWQSSRPMRRLSVVSFLNYLLFYFMKYTI